MTHSSISRKPPTGSLASRVLLVSVFLLAIPLFLQNLFLYRQEYFQKLNDVKQSLAILAHERASLIYQIIERQWAILEIVPPEDWSKRGVRTLSIPSNLPNRFSLSTLQSDALLVGIKISSQKAIAIHTPFSALLQELSQESDSPYPIRMALLHGSTLLAESKQVDSRRELITVQLPIEGSDATLELTIPQESIGALHKKNYYYRIATLLFFTGILGGGAVIWLTQRIAKPLNALCKTMSRVSEGAIHCRYRPDLMGFEINALGKQFNDTLDALLKHQQEAQNERINRERLAEELKIGLEIQTSLFPTHLPDFPGVTFGSAYTPATEVSGDFYDLFVLENGSLLICIADTVGKGISACLYSLGLRSMIRSFALKSNNLSEIVLNANNLFWLDAKGQSTFVTLWIGIYDPQTSQLTYCSQGHPPACICRKTGLEELSTQGIALGAQELDALSTRQTHIAPGELLFLYTDGVTEAHNANKELFGKERLMHFLIKASNTPPQLLTDRLLQELQRYGGDAPQHDDIAMLSLKIIEPPA